jgi:hypothetical protein
MFRRDLVLKKIKSRTLLTGQTLPKFVKKPQGSSIFFKLAKELAPNRACTVKLL